MVQVREVSGEGYSDEAAVLGWVYEGRRTDADWVDKPEGTRHFVAYLDDVPASACQVHDYTLAIGEADLKCGGIAMVGTLGEHRRTGVGAELMQHALVEMRHSGVPLAALYAYREPYYRRLGYEVCGWRWLLRCPQHRIPKTECELPLRRLDVEDVEQLAQAYTPFARRRSGCALRTPEQWRIRLGSKPPMIYVAGNPIEAYAWVHIDGFWNDLNVGEIAWSTRRGYDSILAVLGGLCSNQTALVWCEPPDSPFLARFRDHQVEASLHRPTMFRVVDVPGAMRLLRPVSTGQFTLEVLDDLLPANRGPWRVEFSPDGVEVTPCDHADIQIDIRHFSQMLMGSPSLAELHRMGLVEVADPRAFHAAIGLFEPRTVVCMEYF